MCSVVGYVGTRSSRSFVLQGLTRLEYRGYDSAGFACLQTGSGLACAKATGAVQNLCDKLESYPIDGTIGIGHTRWATHGASTEQNAHPHVNGDNTIAVVHNGIIENHRSLRAQLAQDGYVMRSETDTELIAHLFEHVLKKGGALQEAAQEVASQLTGAFACVVMLAQYPETLVLMRKRSPLCIAQTEDAMLVASDQLAFTDKASQIMYLPDESIALVTQNSVEVYEFSGKPVATSCVPFKQVHVGDLKQGYPHYMLKEIYEQKQVIKKTVQAYQALHEDLPQQFGLPPERLGSLSSVTFVGCGTSWHAGRIARYFFEQLAGIKTQVLLGSEVRSEPSVSVKSDLFIGISQSGETADTLEALRFAQSADIPTVALVNVPTSSMVRESNGYLPLCAGTEIAVASTKAFTAQLAALYMLAHQLGAYKGLVSEHELQTAAADLHVVAELLEHTLQLYADPIKSNYAPRYAQYPHALFLGRHISFPFAQEASLKLQELSYMFTSSCPAGELKHGPLALVDETMPTIMFSVDDDGMYQKILANAHEIKARKGILITFAFDGQQELIELADTAFVIPRVPHLLGPLVMTGLMQYFVYAISHELGRPIDKPRNLAKSVTVE